TAGPPPRYGTCTMSTPVTLLNSSQYMWGALPIPAEATVSLPGLLLAKAISSGTLFTASDGIKRRVPSIGRCCEVKHVTVGRRFGDRLGRESASGAGAIFDEELLTEMLRQPLSD